MTLKPGLSRSSPPQPSPGRPRPTPGPAMPTGEEGEEGAERGGEGGHCAQLPPPPPPRRGGQSAGGGPSSRQALLESARAAFFFPELSATTSPYLSPSCPPGPTLSQHGVDTLITDSNGNTSRYDSSEHILAPFPHPPPPHHHHHHTPSPSPSGGSSARLSGGSSSGGGGQRGDNSGSSSSHHDRSSSGSRADTDPFFSSSSYYYHEANVPGRYDAVSHFNNNDDSNNPHQDLLYNLNDVGMTPPEGVHRRSSPGTPAWRSSQGLSPKPNRRRHNHHHHPPRTSHSFSASTPTHHRRPVRRRSSSTSSDDDMSQESPTLPHDSSSSTTPNPFSLNPDVANLQGQPQQPHPHHIRAASFREPKMAGKQNSRAVEGGGVVVEGGERERGVMGQARRNSMPNVNNLLNVPGASSSRAGSASESPKESTRIRRVRSFKTTSKGGIVNRGDSFKKKSTHSLMSTGSTVTDSDARARCNSGNNNNLTGGVPAEMCLPGVVAGGPAYFRVKVMGAAGVGKTSMAHQFLTSESVDHDDADEGHQMTVTVLLDGDESTIEFIDTPTRNGMGEDQEHPSDAYVVVYAINDHDSFLRAEQLVRFLRVDYGTDRAIVLVANKIDLVRKRKVTADEARLVATTFDCKYAETSAALNHHVDELLVGIITQIRLQLAIPFTTIFFPHKDAKRRKDKKTLCKGPKGFFSRLFKRSSSHSGKRDRGVDNLLY